LLKRQHNQEQSEGQAEVVDYLKLNPSEETRGLNVLSPGMAFQPAPSHIHSGQKKVIILKIGGDILVKNRQQLVCALFAG